MWSVCFDAADSPLESEIDASSNTKLGSTRQDMEYACKI
jgi:hypothetical protein